MRVRAVVLTVVLAASLTACGGGSDPKSSGSPSNPSTRLATTPGSPLTDVTVPCTKFSGVAQRIAEAETQLYSGSASMDSLGALLAELNTLKDGAPSDVKKALDDLGDAFSTAQDEIKAPTAEGTAKLQAMASRLSDDGQKITAYVISKCTS